MHMLLKDIQWKCDGMRPVEDCNLPINVLAINVPYTEFDLPGLHEYIGELLSETYGFMHYGCTIEHIQLDGPFTVDVNAGTATKMPYRSAVPWPKLVDAVLDAFSL